LNSLSTEAPVADSSFSVAARASASIARTVHRAHKLGVIVGTPAYRAALRHGVAAATEHHRSPRIPTPSTVLDVGANRGQFALVARHRFPSAALLCFEPLPKPRERLERALGGAPNVRIFPYALGQASGTTTFRVTTDDDSSSILPTTSIQRSLSPGSTLDYETQVEIKRLDDLIDIQELPRPIFMKIDVQGTELDVLRGASAFAKVVDDILVECSFLELYEGQALAADVIDFLSGWGLSIIGVHNVVATPDGRSAQADLHFSRRTA
jgi:FkbM family methyltransferase